MLNTNTNLQSWANECHAFSSDGFESGYAGNTTYVLI